MAMAFGLDAWGMAKHGPSTHELEEEVKERV